MHFLVVLWKANLFASIHNSLHRTIAHLDFDSIQLSAFNAFIRKGSVQSLYTLYRSMFKPIHYILEYARLLCASVILICEPLVVDYVNAILDLTTLFQYILNENLPFLKRLQMANPIFIEMNLLLPSRFANVQTGNNVHKS